MGDFIDCIRIILLRMKMIENELANQVYHSPEEWERIFADLHRDILQEKAVSIGQKMNVHHCKIHRKNS